MKIYYNQVVGSAQDVDLQLTTSEMIVGEQTLIRYHITNSNLKEEGGQGDKTVVVVDVSDLEFPKEKEGVVTKVIHASIDNQNCFTISNPRGEITEICKSANYVIYTDGEFQTCVTLHRKK